MPRYIIGPTQSNIGLRSTIQPIFSTDSLHTAGGRLYPRVTSGGTAVSELRGDRYLYVLPSIEIYDVYTESVIENGGTVQVTAPMTISPASSISLSPNYIIDGGDYSSITLQYTNVADYTFIRWASVRSGTTQEEISTSSTVILDITDSLVYDAINLYAVITYDPGAQPEGGSGGSGGSGGGGGGDENPDDDDVFDPLNPPDSQ